MRHVALAAVRRVSEPSIPVRRVAAAAGVPTPLVERIEPRRMFAVGGTIEVDGFTATVTGTDGDDVIRLERVGFDDVIVTVNSTTRRFDLDDVSQYHLRGLGGADDISALNEPPVFVFMVGGAGVDTMSTNFALMAQGEIFRDGVRTVATKQHDGSLAVVGTAGDDVISLTQDTEGKNVRVGPNYTAMFLAEEFNDFTVTGRGGDDELSVGDVFSGRVTLVGDGGAGEAGDDVFSVAPISRVSVVGGPGDDLVRVRGDAETAFQNLVALQGGTGVDTLEMDAQGFLNLNKSPDVENVANAHGTVFGNFLSNRIAAAPGDTRPLEARGGGDDDTLIGGAAADQLFGDEDDDTLFGNGGDDLLDGGTGIDRLDGGPGDDTLVNGENNLGPQIFIQDQLLTAKGTLGADTFRIDRVGIDDVRITVNGVVRTFDMDDFDRINFRGGPGDDTMTAGSGVADLEMFGGAGADRLNGNELRNVFAGGDGNDTVNAGGGNDAVFGNPGNDSLNGGAGNDTVSGGDGDDTLTGGGGSDGMNGDDGNDTFFTRDGVADSLSGGPGTDRSQHDGIDSRTGIEQTIP